ncbi:MAG TPA: rhodanese-like domain-containing protein [Gemmatimonadales bacterium]|nr:rhodanese-like domain-containing protein [Gemmatimonadales bacterium]
MRRVSLLLLGLGMSTPCRAQVPRLLTTDSLAGWLRAPSGSEVVLLDVREPWVSYLQDHLPGAAWLNVETLRATEGELPFQLLPPSHYAELFRRLGLAPETPVVVYSAGDQLDIDATFVAWLLASAGATRVYLLDGGYAKWVLEGRPLTQHYPRRPLPIARFDAGQFHPTVASLADVQAALRDGGPLLVDARPADQYSGAAGAQLRRGHIPGARNHPWKDDLVRTDSALVWKSVTALRAVYMAQGITPDRDIILYCNSSTEASHVLFTLSYLLGYPRVRIFTGAWSEWSEREDLPIER